jgi:transcriptional regulator with XRE-family HTH domain
MVETGIAVFAANVSRLCREKKLSQAEVANRSAIHVTEVLRIERGLCEPHLSTLVRLARALDVKAGQLLDGI